MSKALESGKSLAELVLAKLPESLRADAAKAFTAPEAADALTLLGESALARSDYSKSKDELKKQEDQLVEDYNKLQAWYDGKQGELAKAKELEAEIARLKGDPNRPIAPVRTEEPVKDALSKEELNKILEENNRSLATVLGVTTSMASKHYADFNEPLDANELIAYATSKNLSLTAAYQEKFADKIAAKAKAARDAEVEKQVQERLAEERKKFTDQPFPLRNSSPSVLDIIETKGDPSKHTLDSALAEYERLQAARG